MIGLAQFSQSVLEGVVEASGLPPERVMWKFQNADAPAYDYVTLQLPTEIQLGVDYLHKSFDATRARGQEFRIEVRGTRELPLEIECFAAVPVPASDPDLARAAVNSHMSRASTIRAALLLPRVRRYFTAVGCSILKPGPIASIPQVIKGGWRGRAAMTVRCLAPAEVLAQAVEYATYIELASVHVVAHGGATDPQERDAEAVLDPEASPED